MIQDSVERVVKSALEHGFPGASEIVILDVQDNASQAQLTNQLVRVRWSMNGLTHVGQLEVRAVQADVASLDAALLPALRERGVPVQRVLPVENSDIGAYLVLEHLAGVSMALVLTDVSMRWELSAHGFTFARGLAQIHNLDWRKIAPWMGDPDALPEDMISSQLDDWLEDWEERAARCPEQYRGHVESALAWIDERRPTEVSVSLCHGDYRPTNVIVAQDEIAAIVNWEHALVTDASYDLCLLPFEIRQMKLPDEDADLLTQAIFGSYLQSSSRSLGNMQFFAVIRLLSAGLGTLDRDEGTPGDLGVFTTDPNVLFAAMRKAMSRDGEALWRV